MRERFEESQIQKSLKVVSEGSGASLKRKKGGARGKGVGEIKEAAQELVHFCARYAPIVRLAAPSAATPKTVLIEGQEQLKTESLCLSYSSTNASWERDRKKKTDSELSWQRICVFLQIQMLWFGCLQPGYYHCVVVGRIF